MRKRLGEGKWNAFVRCAEAWHKEAFVRSFTPPAGVLCCKGKMDGTPCPRRVEIRLRESGSERVAADLPGLHMDHSYDVKHICDVWSRALPPDPRSWDDGICGPLIAHLLFGTEDHVRSEESDSSPIWKKQIHFRCGNVNGAEGQSASHFCHDVAGAHYGNYLRTSDIALQKNTTE